MPDCVQSLVLTLFRDQSWLGGPDGLLEIDPRLAVCTIITSLFPLF